MRKYWGILLVTGLVACQPYSTSDLAGTWQAVGLTDSADSLEIDLSEVRFTFDADGGYTFVSTLNYREAGSYRLDGPYLFTTDTLHSLSREKAVEIQQLANDSLVILMNEAGRDRVLTLLKQ